MRIFVTGIDGFVGRHLAAHLAAKGNRIWGCAGAAGARVAGAEHVVACDVRDEAAVAGAIGEAEPEAVVHLAGQTSNAAAFDRAAETFAVNVLGAVNVLEACRAAGVERVLLVTSAEAYGEGDPSAGLTTEDAPLAPVTPYGASKAAQDVVGYQVWRTYGLSVIRARPCPHTGPGQDPRFVFPSVARGVALAEAGLGPEEIELGALDVVRDVTDVRDVVEAYERLLALGAPGEAYNVCRGDSRPLRAWLAAFADQARRPVRFVSRPERLRLADVRWLAADPAKLRDATGWRPRVEWEETVRDLLDEWRSRVAQEATVPEKGRHANA